MSYGLWSCGACGASTGFNSAPKRGLQGVEGVGVCERGEWGIKMKSECRNANAIAIVKVKLNALRQCLAVGGATAFGFWLKFLSCFQFFSFSLLLFF